MSRQMSLGLKKEAHPPTPADKENVLISMQSEMEPMLLHVGFP